MYHKGGFPAMAEITRILAAKIRRQFFFLIRVLTAWFKIVNLFAVRSESMPRHNTTTVVVQDVQNGRTIGWLQW